MCMFKAIEGGAPEPNHECANHSMHTPRRHLYSKPGVVEIFCVGLRWDRENTLPHGFKVTPWTDYPCERRR